MANYFIKIRNYIEKHKWIAVFLLAIPFFNEVYPPISLLGDNFEDGIKIIAFLCMIYIMHKKKRKPSVLFKTLVVIEAWWLISTLCNYPLSELTVYRKLIMDNINAFSMGLLVESFLDDPKALIMGLMLNFELAIYPDTIVSFIKPLRDNQQLLGYYSVHILWTLPALCVLLLNIDLNKQYVRSFVLLASILILTVRTWCATIVVAFMGFFAIIFLGLLLSKIGRFKNFKLPLWPFVVFAIALNVFVLFIYTAGTFPFIDFFIEKFLRRSTSFTERVVIWQEAMRMIREKPLIGYGFRPVIGVANSSADSFIHAHNQLLQRLTATGIIGLITFAVFHVITIIKVDKSKNSFARLVMMGGIFGVCFTYITEGYKKFFRFYLVFFLAYHVDELIRGKVLNNDYLLK